MTTAYRGGAHRVERCIYCASKPLCFTGHIHKKQEIVTAGFCNVHKYKVVKFNACDFGGGCLGQWFKRYGLIDETS